MTPDAVLHRYITLLGAGDIRVEELYSLISLDAGLLREWLYGLASRAEPEAIKTALGQLEPGALKRLALSQAWAVTPMSAGARPDFDTWRSRVLCSFVAAALARQQEYSDPESVRLKILLAQSGISIEHDPLMCELLDFRSSDVKSLQDAHPLLRFLAVVECFSAQGADEAGKTAELLLHMSRADFQRLLQQAVAECNALIATLAIAECSAEAWQDPLWLHARLASFASLLARPDDRAHLARAHRLISGSLFHQLAPCFVLDPRENTLSEIEKGCFQDFRIHVLHSPSVLARAMRERRMLEVSAAEQLIVVDRQLMRRLDATVLQIVPLLTAQEAVGVLLFKVTEQNASALELLAQLYADELAYWLMAQREEQLQSGYLLQDYRTRQEKRLREIVHEANNPLSIIHNYLHILELRLQRESGAREQLNLIAEEIRRTSEIIKRVVDFPAPDAVAATEATVERNRFDLNRVAAKVMELVEGQAQNAGIELKRNFYPGEVILVSDDDSVTQVMTNLVKNAVEAMPGGGHISVETLRGVYRAGRAGVEFVVRDDGPGIADEVIQQLYEPKNFTRGSGLGLHITARLVAALEGALDLRTSAERGTAFSVFLPDLQEPAGDS